MNNNINVGDIIHVALNPDIMGFVREIRQIENASSPYSVQYYVEFFSGPLTEGKHVTYYYKHEIQKVNK